MKKYKVMTRQERLESINKPQTKVTQKKVCPACNEDGTCNNDVVLTHTPTPWKVMANPIEISGSMYEIRGPKGETVALVELVDNELSSPYFRNKDKTDGAFIVRAVNAHEELVKALRKYGRHTRDCDFELERGTCTCGFGLSDMHPLAKAEGNI